jgi:hypothetical protein
MRTLALPARTLRSAVLGVASVALLGLTACGGDDSADDSASGTTTGSSPAAETSAEETASSSAPAAGEQPEWANPVTDPGTSIATVGTGDLTVEVFQVGVTKATDTGFFADPDTNQPLIAVGDDLVFVNYVVTNDGAPVDLGSSLVSISARYDDWPYLQGMDGLTDSALFEQQGVNDDAFTPTAYRDPSVYTFGTGQSYSYGENFEYQAGSPITFEVSVTPVDAAGELLHDQRVEATGSGTIA